MLWPLSLVMTAGWLLLGSLVQAHDLTRGQEVSDENLVYGCKKAEACPERLDAASYSEDVARYCRKHQLIMNVKLKAGA